MNVKSLRNILIAGVLFLAIIYCAQAETEQAELASKIVRLHVVANSDSEADQAYKLQVRDRVLAELAPVLAGSAGRDEALRRIASAMPELSAKFPDCEISIANERFPERQYDTFALPAGEYTALRVTIGSGAGRNWWCVVFPALCLEAAEAENSDSADAFALLSDEEVELITGSDSGYVIKFKLLEIIERLKAALS
ncbi:MAG: stage II sporulation protein R [Oscillospiraceae bacterium]|jgi:stage II sporulation protein R|nr:stage II sporulation protein R [Oscillospiraceae bacterium]